MRKVSVLLLVAMTVSLVPAIAFAGDGAATYKTKCAMCHGPSGEGKAKGTRDLGSAEVQKLTDAQLTSVIATGDGKASHAYKAKGLSDAQISDLVSFIRSLKK
jgi:cytochrome c6